MRKLTASNVRENAEIAHIKPAVLPSSEWQIRPLLTDLQHDGERIHVWQEVVQAGEKGKIIEWTFERWLETEHQITDRHGRRLMCGVDFLRKLTETNRTQNAEMGPAETPVLPSNERQIRPLLTDLQHDGERIHVWSEVVQAGEKKITAELVQRKVDEFKASGQTHQNHPGRAESLRWCNCPASVRPAPRPLMCAKTQKSRTV